VESYIQRSERINPALESLKKILNLPKVPSRIEGFDVSHLFGEHKVASLVVFKDGKPLKSEYRRYRIKTVEGIDDFASMYEVCLGGTGGFWRKGNPYPILSNRWRYRTAEFRIKGVKGTGFGNPNNCPSEEI